MIKMDKEFVDYASVRDALSDTLERRGFLTYKQKTALQHAEWAASDNRNGIRTESKVFDEIFNELSKIESLLKYPEIAAKLAEIMPIHPDDVRAVLASRRIAMETDDIENIIDVIRQKVGVE